jgi:uncharacterized protein (TIGR00269 family)
MINHGDKIAVAVSGGKDSISLLHLMKYYKQNHVEFSLSAITVDEGIQNYREEAMEIATQNCKSQKIEHHVISFKELYGKTLDEIVFQLRKKKEGRLTPCAYCGVLRRKALNIAARKANANKVATAHTLDDEIQTFLLNMLHGDSTKFLSWNPNTNQGKTKLVDRIKPFCEIPEKETALYAYAKKIRFQDNPCPYSSHAMRNDVRTFLNRVEDKKAGIKSSILCSMQILGSAAEKRLTNELLNECDKCGEPTAKDICRACEMLQTLYEYP